MDLILFAYAFLFTISFFIIIVSAVYKLSLDRLSYSLKVTLTLVWTILAMMFALVLFFVDAPLEVIFGYLLGVVGAYILDVYKYDSKVKLEVVLSIVDEKAMKRALELREKVQKKGEGLDKDRDT